MGIGQPWRAGLPGLLSAEGCLGDSITEGLGGLQTPRAPRMPPSAVNNRTVLYRGPVVYGLQRASGCR